VTYTHLYSDIEKVKNNIKNILEGEEIKKSLKNFYRKKLEEYINYINKNILIDFN
jgi:hypothetical protein